MQISRVSWLVCPTLFIAALFGLAIDPYLIFVNTPPLWASPSAETSVARVTPLYPSTMHQAFLLGQLALQCSKWRGVCPASTLAEASELVGKGRKVSSAELLGVEDLVLALDLKKSSLSRLIGILNFVNILAFFSTLGILATIGPMLTVLLGPIFRKYIFSVLLLLGASAYGILKPLIVYVLKTLPTHLHTHGVAEAAGYTLNFLVIATAARYPPEHAAAARMVAVSGGLASVPLIVYSAYRAGQVLGGGDTGTRMVQLLMHAVSGMCLAPIAYIFQSSLAGFLAIFCFYQTLGFYVLVFGLGICIGFQGDDSLLRSCLASKLLLLSYSGLLLTGYNHSTLIAPFAFGIQVMGSVVYFIALLIESSLWQDKNSHKPARYYRINFIMVGSMMLYAFLGSVWSAPALSNTAITFLVLWLLEKNLELVSERSLAWFIACSAVYVACHRLTANPAFLLSLVDPSGVIY
mmetsp:Transcript_18855/g.36674  ORF Transcript_18855/g.36674 Transcript_18855/m.36674 type:complete len:464 (+) Transcript_18855:237-1628(+)